jgi:hypothetical protein
MQPSDFESLAPGRMVKVADQHGGRAFVPAPLPPRVAKTLWVSVQGAQNVIDRLVGLGVLREVTGRQRNRIHLAERIVRMLEEPAPEPGAPP